VAASELCSKCHGARLGAEHCLAHLSRPELDRVAQRLLAGERLNARGVRITTERLHELLDRLRDETGSPQLPRARFEGAHFLGGADFEEAQFLDDAHFDYATFLGEADFRKVQFSKEADFRGTRFTGLARFKEAVFSGEARFHEAQFSGDVEVLRAAFRRRLWLEPAVEVSGRLSLDHVEFDEVVRMDVSASLVSCVGTRFGGRADLNVRRADIVLDGAAFVHRARLVGARAVSTIDEIPSSTVGERAVENRPRLLSVRQADIENLELGHLDLRACRFFGAHGLDKLRIEVNCEFAQTPPSWRYTRRRTIAEEHEWRSSRSPKAGWHQPSCQEPPLLKHAEPRADLSSGEIASVYRSLRKALEDHKDEPGAADFYYGEMEMRRLTRPLLAGRRTKTLDPTSVGTRVQAFGERLVLGLYWLIAGYGLRASRAFGALLLTILLFAVAFHLWGFHDQPFWRSLLFSAQSTTSLFRVPDKPPLEPVGEALQVALRLLGPLLFGLALLSLRGRVKR
jgi:uncharacterized protein YjbI with pentapeptide repeats